jgi:hypothetical protein
MLRAYKSCRFSLTRMMISFPIDQKILSFEPFSVSLLEDGEVELLMMGRKGRNGKNISHQ